jgi:hypothetical protein
LTEEGLAAGVDGGEGAVFFGLGLFGVEGEELGGVGLDLGAPDLEALAGVVGARDGVPDCAACYWVAGVEGWWTGERVWDSGDAY